MKPKLRVILQIAIEQGVRRGYYRAHKHNDKPSVETLFTEIEDGVMSEITEYFNFEDSDF
jgi:hypothetical protein